MWAKEDEACSCLGTVNLCFEGSINIGSGQMRNKQQALMIPGTMDIRLLTRRQKLQKMEYYCLQQFSWYVKNAELGITDFPLVGLYSKYLFY